MKRLLFLLGISAGLTTSLLAQTANDSPRPASVPTGAAKARQNAAIARAVREHRAVYYISTYTPTGSHIPQVICRYEGHNVSIGNSSPGSVYGAKDIGLTGALNVGGALTVLDPAISSVGR